MNEEKLMSFVHRYRKVHDEELAKIPYDFNLIEMIQGKINENMHSRIFVKLCNYMSHEGQYPFVNYLMQRLHSQKSSFPTQVSVNEITAEKMRIDALIRAKGSAIIIENKIENAVDQTAERASSNQGQIFRYIQAMLKSGYSKNDIYVIYLKPVETDEPEDGTWEDDKHDMSLKEEFADRFLILSYKKHILPWLKEFSEECPRKERILHSALVQYIDYLENKFECNIKHTIMNDIIKKMIAKEMGISASSSAKENRNKAREFRDEITKLCATVSDVYEEYNNIYNQQGWDTLYEQLKNDVERSRWPSITDEYIIKGKDDTNWSNSAIQRQIGVQIMFKGVPVIVSVVQEQDGHWGFYCIADKDTPSDSSKSDEIKAMCNEINSLLNQKDSSAESLIIDSSWCYAWQWTSAENAYKRLSSLIDVLTELDNRFL